MAISTSNKLQLLNINLTEFVYFRYGYAFVDQDSANPQLSIPAVQTAEIQAHPAAFVWRDLLVKHHHESLLGESPRRLHIFEMLQSIETEYATEIAAARQQWFPELEVY
jgi:hypothetical protein